MHSILGYESQLQYGQFQSFASVSSQIRSLRFEMFVHVTTSVSWHKKCDETISSGELYLSEEEIHHGMGCNSSKRPVAKR